MPNQIHYKSNNKALPSQVTNLTKVDPYLTNKYQKKNIAYQKDLNRNPAKETLSNKNLSSPIFLKLTHLLGAVISKPISFQKLRKSLIPANIRLNTAHN